MVALSVTLYMVLMLAIGYYSYRRTINLSDYMIGGRSLGPAVTALSAGASDMSGWLMMGLPGALYVSGLSAGWIAIGLAIGAYLNWLLVAPRLRTYTVIAKDSITIPEFLSNRFHDSSHILRLVSGLVIIIFFTFYVSSGIVSGAVLFNSTFGLDYHTGIYIILGVVVAYTLLGGFLAVSLTDFVQGLIMVTALILVPVFTFFHSGGPDSINVIREIDPKLLNIFTGTSLIGIISLFAWGLGYFGQPHIIVRFMAISSIKELKKSRRIGMSWMVFSELGAMLTGFLGIAYFALNPNLTLGDPETVFIELGKLLFHPFVTGFLIAAILAAIMSTISSQLLVTSSSLTEDIYRIFFRRQASEKELVLIGRLSVVLVAVAAAYFAWTKNDTILNLVGYAWAGFGSSFGPVILLSLYWKRMNKWGALAGMIAGAATVIIWEQFPALEAIYEMIPGFFMCGLVAIIVSLLTSPPSEEIQQEFAQCEQEVKALKS